MDCGLSIQASPYKESSTGLTYTSDDGFVQGGKIGRITKELESLYNKPEWTLRYFPDGVRNCYSVNVTRGTKYLIKPSFVYGNYDGLNVIPDFDLYIGPNLWMTVNRLTLSRRSSTYRNQTLCRCVLLRQEQVYLL